MIEGYIGENLCGEIIFVPEDEAYKYALDHMDEVLGDDKDIVVERYGVLTLHYWKATDEENYQGVRFPADIEKREVRLLSDHYPVQVNVLLNGAKKR